MFKPSFDYYLGKVEQVTESGCWIWLGSWGMQGYGRIRVDGVQKQAHRVFYEHFKGKIPTGLTLDHLCRVRCCVNPEHLDPVTNQENVLRGIGLTAQNARKTHCKNGHLLCKENMLNIRDGSRECRICRLDDKRKVYHLTREQRRAYWHSRGKFLAQKRKALSTEARNG